MKIAWPKAKIWKRREIRRGFVRGRCPLHLGEEYAKHIQIKCSEMKKRRKKFTCSKWLRINEDRKLKKIINCSNVTKVKKQWKAFIQNYKQMREET
jgi:hypothetical protein